MENICLKNTEELDKFIEEHRIIKLGAGQEGSCYVLDSGDVIKRLFREYNPSFALQFSDIENSSFIFSKKAVLINGYANALFMDFAKGKSLREHMPYDQSIESLAIQLQKLVDDIKDLSKQGVLVKDFHCGNIIYDENTFKIIDTLCYLRFPNSNYWKENINEIMLRIYSNLLYQILNFKEVPDEFVYSGRPELFENPYEYLIKLKKVVENLTEHEIITLDDAKKVLTKKYG